MASPAVTLASLAPSSSPQGYCAMLVLVVYKPQERRSASCSQHCKLAWCLAPRSQSLGKGLKNLLQPGVSGAVSEMHGVWDCPSTSGGQSRATATSCMLWESLRNLDQQLKRRCLKSATGVSVRWSLAFGGSVVSTPEKSSFEPYMYVYTQNYVCSRVCFYF